MEYDQKEYLELLQPFKSEETRKSRRNVVTISFIVISVWLLDIKLTDVKVLGVDLSHSSAKIALLLALALIIYWTFMFFVSWFNDQEFQKERSRQLDAQVEDITKRFEILEKRRQDSESKGHQFIPSSYPEIKAAYESHISQQERTAKAKSLAIFLHRLEFWLPVVLVICAFIIIIGGLLYGAPDKL